MHLGWFCITDFRHTSEVLQTVRQRLRVPPRNRDTIALVAMALAVLVAAAALVATRGQDATPTQGSLVRSINTEVADPQGPVAGPVGQSTSSVGGMISGFGLIGFWVVVGGAALVKARRPRRGMTPEEEIA